MECELLAKGTTIEGALQDLLADVDDVDELRAIMAALIDMNQTHLRRHGVDEICFETHLPHSIVVNHLDVLTRKSLVARDEVSGSPLFSLASRSLREPLFRVLELRQFAEKKEAREILRRSSLDDSLLDGSQLDLVRRWKDGMVFSKEGMGRILASLIGLGEDCRPFLEKAKHDNSGIDIQPILKFLRSEGTAERERAIRLLLEVQDKNIVNPLLTHLKNETIPELKDLIIRGMWATGKKRRIIAVMRTLKENGDRGLRLRAIGFLRTLPPKTAKNLLVDLMETEDDPILLEELRRLLPKQGT
jgi:DNA-binding transcriptional ArsR family regulator